VLIAIAFRASHCRAITIACQALQIAGNACVARLATTTMLPTVLSATCRRYSKVRGRLFTTLVLEASTILYTFRKKKAESCNSAKRCSILFAVQERGDARFVRVAMQHLHQSAISAGKNKRRIHVLIALNSYSSPQGGHVHDYECSGLGGGGSRTRAA
jgi:hypothetical protein